MHPIYQVHPLRKGRVSLPFHYYSVTIVHNERLPVFLPLTVARRIIQNLYLFDSQGGVKTVCYCLMPDHLHWLFQLQDKLTLSEVAGQFKGRSTTQLYQCSNLSGRIWQEGFYDHCIRSEEELRHQARYIVANPLRAKLVSSIGDYPYWDCIYL